MAALSAALAGCPAPDQPMVDVELRTRGVEITANRPRQMRDMLVGEGADRFHGRAHPVGLTDGDIQVESSFVLAYGGNGRGTQLCMWPRRLQIVLETSSSVFVTEALPKGSCEYRAVLEHEMKHVETDRKIARDYSWVLRDRLRAAAAIAGPFERADMGAAREQIKARLERVVAAVADEMYAARSAAQDAVDSPQEYERVGAACQFPGLFVVNGSRPRATAAPRNFVTGSP